MTYTPDVIPANGPGQEWLVAATGERWPIPGPLVAYLNALGSIVEEAHNRSVHTQRGLVTLLDAIQHAPR